MSESMYVMRMIIAVLAILLGCRVLTKLYRR
jgi:hypothetical protein